MTDVAGLERADAGSPSERSDVVVAPFPPPDRRFLLAAGALSLVAFWGAWWVLGWLSHNAFYGYVVISDVGIYQRFADAVLSGQLPYRDFSFEYPPAALVPFLVPALLRPTPGDIGPYVANFESFMLVCGLVATLAVLVTTWRLGAGRGRIALALGFMAVSPLLVGPIILSRYDLWPAALLAVTMALVSARRYRFGALFLGIAIAAKIYPIVVVPILAVHVWRTAGRREFVLAGIVLVVVLANLFVPFLILSPAGLLDSLTFQLNRPLQVESLGAAFLFVAHGLSGLPLTVQTSFGGQNLAGALPQAFKTIEALLEAASLVGIWVWFARGDVGRRRAILASAAAVTAFVAFDSTISPQYMIWLIPVIPAVQGRCGLAAMVALAVALQLTALYFPKSYFDLVRSFDQRTAWIVLLRDLSLVAVLVILAVPLRRLWERARESYRAFDERVHPARFLPDAGTAVFLVLASALLLRALWLSLPPGSLIFDESYYVNAARTILGIHVASGAPYAGATLGLDPNSEHPPLGKVLIAGSMLLFGDNGLGWRFPSLIAGMIALIAVYGIVRAAGGTPWLGVLATLLYSLDVLSFIHGRIGVLDMLSLAPILVGAWLWLNGRWALAGAMLAIGTLVKLTGLYGLLAALAWLALGLLATYRRNRLIAPRDLLPLASLVGTYVVVGLLGLWWLDMRFTAFATPFDHLQRMLGYGFALQPTFNPSGIASAPWDWLVNGGQFDYFKVAVNTLVDGKVTGSRATIEFRALLNPVLIGSALLAVLYAGWRAWKADDGVSRWSLIWIGANFLPYVALALFANRITYFYYVLPTVPALAVATAVLLVGARLPRFVVWGYVLGAIVAFIAYFPFRQVP